jgi:signal transduction histidine kinase
MLDTTPHRHIGTERLAMPARAAAHVVQFYAADDQLERAIARFAADALAAGQAVLIAATPAHRAAVVRLLKRRSPPADLTRVVFLDATETLARCLVDGRPDRARFNEVISAAASEALALAPRVAIFGELVELLCAAGKHDQALELERFWHDLLARMPASLLCGYAIQSFGTCADGDAFQRVCDAHGRVYPVEDAEQNEDRRRRATALLQQRLRALETEAEERERALRARNDELTAALGAREQFLNIAAHELKTPITSLRVYAQLLQRDIRQRREVAPERLEAALQAIERQTGQLAQLVDRLLDIGRIEAGALQVERAPCDLVALVRHALCQFERAGSHRIAFDAPDALPVEVDPIRLEQVVTILLCNALRYSPAGSTVSVEIVPRPGGVELAVADEGRGVPLELRESIFEPFHGGEERRHIAGLGLSLPIARRIIELHGGAIRVEPVPGGGSRFAVTLPTSVR